MKQSALLLSLLLPTSGFSQSVATQQQQNLPKSDYATYHRVVVEAEELIADQKYDEALATYRKLVDNYDFVFRRDYQIATQLAVQAGRVDEAFDYLKRGMAGGWEMKSIKKNKFLRKLRDNSEWKEVRNEYPSLRQQYQKRLNPAVRTVVKKMFGSDQWKALGALFTFGSNRQDRYAETKFAPHSEKQMAKLATIIETYGYPGEKLIGNGFRASVIVSHHNSISQRYTLADTLYSHIRPKLLNAIALGQMSPYEFAMVDDWYIAVSSGRKTKGYGYLTAVLTEAERIEANQLRRVIGLSSVETINRLIDVQQQTGINPYLPSRSDFVSGKKSIVK